MYKEHKRIIVFSFIALFCISCYFKLDYRQISSDGITIVSIALAVYIASFSSLTTSNLARVMENKSDRRIPGKSELGVLQNYLQDAIILGLGCIVISCTCKLLNEEFIGKRAYLILSSFGIASLGANLMFVWLMFKFMLNRQLRDR